MTSIARRRRIVIDDEDDDDSSCSSNTSSGNEDSSSVEVLKNPSSKLSSNNNNNNASKTFHRKNNQIILDDDDSSSNENDKDVDNERTILREVNVSKKKSSTEVHNQTKNTKSRQHRPIIFEDSSSSDRDNDEVDLLGSDSDDDVDNEVDLMDSDSDKENDGLEKKTPARSQANNNCDNGDNLLENMMSSLQVSSPTANSDDGSKNGRSSASSSSSSCFYSPSSSRYTRASMNQDEQQEESYSSSSDSSLLTPTQSSSKSSTSSNSEDSKSTGITGFYDDEYDDCAWKFSNKKKDYHLSRKKYSIEGVTWPKVSIPCDLYGKLYTHQKEGVQWMASLHSNGIGGILGDDMGLGKTYQTLTFLGGLMRSQTIRNALIIAPVSVLRSWEKEANEIIKQQCVPRVNIIVASSDVHKRRRYNMLLDAQECSSRNPYLVITTYGLVRSAPLDFVAMEKQDNRPCWDYVVCDEGHLIKNPSAQVSKSCRRICKNQSTRRLLLTGTPIQNNLKEMWALFDWATSGRLLGKLKVFDNRFAIPIEEGRNKFATNRSMNIAEKCNNELQALIRPHFLQRLKKTTFGEKLPTKRELVVFTHLSSKQRKMYETYIKGEKVGSVLRGEVASPLESITWLKKLCGHTLLVERQGQDLGLASIDAKKLIRRSAKLEVLVALIDELRKSRHRTLIFSQSTRMLDIIERTLAHVNTSRIDGSTKQKDRQRFVDDFNNNRNVDAMLLSTKAAGLGLTLTGADRAIIYDPSWNPAEDSQAVDRCYRIGQMKNVTVYRLIAAGTVEEKMYEKQVHKDGIRRAVMTTSGTATERFFDKKELKKLFQLAPAGECEILEKIRKDGHVEDDGVSNKRSFVQSHGGVVGMASHDDIYSRSVIEIKGDQGHQTPFSTPAKNLGRAQLVLSKQQLNFDDDDDDDVIEVSKPRRKEDKKETSTKKLSGSDKKTVRLVETPCSTDGKKSETVFEVADSPIACSDGEAPQSVFDKATELEDQGDRCSAMNLFLDLLETNQLTGSDKLKLHKRIAALARKLESIDKVAWF